MGVLACIAGMPEYATGSLEFAAAVPEFVMVAVVVIGEVVAERTTPWLVCTKPRRSTNLWHSLTSAACPLSALFLSAR